MIWSFLEDERADLALAAARASDPAVWNADFGAAARARWEAAEVPAGTGTLVLRGVGSSDWVAVDGAALEGESLPAGLHVLQVGQADTARFARLLQVDPDATVEVAVPEGSGAAPTMQLASATPFGDIAPPILRDGSGYADGDGDPLSWRLQVQPLASADPGGRASLQLYRSNTLQQVATVVVGTAAAYGTYLVGWDAAVGSNLDKPVSVGLTVAGVGVVAGAGALEFRWLSRRQALRRDIEAAANRALMGNPP